MNSSFPSILVAVLTGQPEITELPNNRLVASDQNGVALEEKIPRDLLFKIARLQTLSAQARKDAEIPSFEDAKQIAEETGAGFIVTGTNALGVQEDATHRIMMIERLIVEIVREAFPAECGQFDVHYAAHISGRIIRCPTQSRRFLG